MKTYRTNGFIGIVAVLLSAITIVVMAELRTDGYNHFHKAVSELGSMDAPNKWVFNIFGYVIPGILIAIFSIYLLIEFRDYHVKSYPFYMLIGSGLLLALSGVFPVDMEHKTSIGSIMHSVGSIGSGIFWLLSALTLWWQLRKNIEWKITALCTFLIPFGMIAAMCFVPDDTPGISQRIAFLADYLFILVLADKQVLMAANTANGIMRNGD